MNDSIIHSHPGLVDVLFRRDLDAVNLIWHSEYDEGTGVRDAVLAATDYARANGVKGWLADISQSVSALSDADLAWVSGEEFCSAIRNAGLARFVLVPPLPETGQDTSWLEHWEANTLAAFGDQVEARILSKTDEINEFLTRPPTGEAT